MPSRTVEDYLKSTYILQQEQPGSLVAMGALANAMSVAPGTATAMVKTLAESGLVDYEPRSGVRLTDRGQTLALHVLRRHRLVELFLVKIVGLDWSEVHAEADELEHAISDKVLEKIDELLGFPTVDPHGDPIPTAAGTVTEEEMLSLDQCRAGHSVNISRMLDQDPAFLQFAERHGLTPGTRVTVQVTDPIADTVSVNLGGERTATLGLKAARKILTEPALSRSGD